jgi:murein DD-endopeptidase MepM/ murein hydrolase activator NlpD
MRILWREAGIAALVCGALTACASPAYPINEDQTPGPAPLTMGKPAYPIVQSSAPAAAPRPARAASSGDAEPNDAPLAAPVAPVESRPLAAPSASNNLGGSRSDGARLQFASLSAQAAPATATTTAPATSSPTATAPVATAPTATAPAPTPATTAPATTAATPAPAPAAEPALTPQMVVHDQPSSPSAPTARPPPVREASAAAAPAPGYASGGAHMAIAGDVIAASGSFFQNYEVQRGDHIDELARAFSTTRKVLLDANDIRAPFVIHPGQIMRVPVTKAYVARSGDTLVGVARRFSVGVDELAQLNHIPARGDLRPGQEVGLPSSMRDRGPIRDTEYAAYSPPRGYAPSSTMPVRQSGEIPGGPAPVRPTSGYVASPPPTATAQAAPSMSDSDIAQAARGRFVWPVRGDMLTRFGTVGVGRRNDGIDIRASQGTVVKAAAAGEVVYAGNQVPGFGNLVLIKHADGWVTAYAHLDEVDVQMKQQVTQGQAVGSVGATGGATEPELHFEVRYAPTPAEKARPVDPVLVLPLG